MFSNTLRTWSKHNKNFDASIMFKVTTGVASFHFSRIEARTRTPLEPIEWLTLKAAEVFGTITRIEIHILSGFTLAVVEDVLNKMEESGLLNIEEFDRDSLNRNLAKLEREFGDEWKTHQIINILNRPYIIQYTLTDDGKKALEENFKTLEEIVDLNVFVIGTPFKLFFDELVLKAQSYEEVDVDTQLANKVLFLAQKEGEGLESGMVPLAITNDTAISGFEVASADFWLLVETPEGEESMIGDGTSFLPFLTSIAFIRWSSPPTKDPLSAFIKVDMTAKDVVTRALSNKYQMVESVIQEGLKLNPETNVWTLTTDIEMAKLIYAVDREPIEKHVAEIQAQFDGAWHIIVQLNLKPMETLDAEGIYAARFHSRVDRTGFTFDEGFEQWKSILQEEELENEKNLYQKVLALLVEYKCLKKEMPKIPTLVVNLDYFLSFGQRPRQPWKFSRIKLLEKMAETAGISKIYYYATEEIFGKIDNIDSFDAWRENTDFTIVDNHAEPFTFAIQNKFHYIGFNPFLEDENDIFKNEAFDQKELGKMRVGRKFVRLSGGSNLQIPDFEPIYHWLPENILEKLYTVYYE